MKINRFLALALIALLAVGGMGAFTYRSFAQGASQTAQQTQTCAEDDDANEAPDAADTDNLDEQCGDQVEDGQPDKVEGNEAAYEADSGVQEPPYAGSISVDQTQTENLSEADEAADLQGQATITADEASTAALAANPGAAVTQIELDNENGTLVYSVQLDNGSDVKVDAGNGIVLYTDSGQDGEN